MRRVITVSRQTGTDGYIVARHVANHLGFQIFDKKLIAETAEKLGIDRNKAIACDITEDDYEFRSYIEPTFGTRELFCLLDTRPEGYLKKEKKPLPVTDQACMTLEGTIVKELASRGNVVIVGRGGQSLLRDHPGTLHVKIIAPHNYRTTKLMRDERISLGEAYKIVWDRDRATEQYLLRYHNVDWNDDGYYDMVVNISQMSVHLAASQIIKMARYI